VTSSCYVFLVVKGLIIRTNITVQILYLLLIRTRVGKVIVGDVPLHTVLSIRL